MNAQASNSQDEWYRWSLQSVRGYAVFTTNLQGRIVTWDQGAIDLFEYRREDVVGQDARFIFTTEDIRQNEPAVEMANAIGHRSARDERWHVRKDGTLFWASGLLMAILDDEGRHVGFIKIVRPRPPPEKPRGGPG